MTTKFKKSALAFSSLKLGQQILHDLDKIVLNDSAPDYLRFGAEHLCRVGAAIAAVNVADYAINYFEESLPKFIRGIIPLAATTIGAGAVINYLGDYMNLQEGIGVIETTKTLIENYHTSIEQLVNINPEVNGGYLAGAFLTIKSAGRVAYNFLSAITNADRK